MQPVGRIPFCGSKSCRDQNGFSFARPFFFLCLLDDSSFLSNAGLVFLPLGFGACAAGWGWVSTSLTTSGTVAGFSAAGNGVALGGPTAVSPPFASPGFADVPEDAPVERISTPMELPPVAGVAGALPGTAVITAPAGTLASAVGTSSNLSGAAGAAAAAGAGAAPGGGPCLACPFGG